jgi:hypothetical protein
MTNEIVFKRKNVKFITNFTKKDLQTDVIINVISVILLQ